MINSKYLTTKILVVDDFATMRKIIKQTLQQIGFKDIQEASDGTEAWEKLNAEPFQLIISDWNMPKMPGIELLKKVRSAPQLAKIPFIMVTAEGQKECVIEAAKAGVTNYIVKPFTAETLEEKLNLIFK